MDIRQLDSEYIASTYKRFDKVLVSGSGSKVKDEDGREYIDLGSGIAVNTLGIADDGWISAVSSQLSNISHTSNLYYNAPCTELARELCVRSGMKRVFFANSGAEANECAIKTARKYASDKKGKDTYRIITLKNSFHGRTITTLAATGQDEFHTDFGPLTEGFSYACPNDLDDVKNLAEENKTAAIMIEIVQGEGGVLPLSRDFVIGLAEFCAAKDILLICDEVQCGNGRTGKLYGYMNYGIIPDIVTTAKGLGGGLPIGACLLGEKVSDTLTAGTHGSTFGGNPAICAGALYIMSQLDEKLMNHVNLMSKLIFDTLSGKKGIKSITGMGLMIGIETVPPVAEVINYCMEHGVLIIKAKNKVRLLPALNIPENQLKAALDVIADACAKG